MLPRNFSEPSNYLSLRSNYWAVQNGAGSG